MFVDLYDFVNLEFIHSEAIYAVLRINADDSDIVNTNCTMAGLFGFLLICFFPWTIASFASGNFGYEHNIAYF